MKFETVLFAVAFACLGLISIPKEKAAEKDQTAKSQISAPEALESDAAMRLSQASD